MSCTEGTSIFLSVTAHKLPQDSTQKDTGTLLRLFLTFMVWMAPGIAWSAPEPLSRADLPIVIDSEDGGVVTVEMNQEGTEFRVQTADIFASILPLATPELQMQIWNSSQDGFISGARLQELGLTAKINLSTLVLEVSIPPQLRKPGRVSLAGSVAGDINAQSASVSAVVNAFGSRSVWHENPSARSIDNGARGDFNAAVNVLDFVLEGQSSYTEYDLSPWRRGDIRLVHDIAPKMLRLTAGDLLYPATGYATYMPLGGLSVARELTMDPDLLLYPTTRYEVHLKNPSRVDIAVNGTIVRTLRLPAGRFDIRDIPLGARVNRVELFITDPFGRTEKISFPFIASSELLRPGLHQFSYNLGYPSVPLFGRYEYSENRLTTSLQHRFGLTDKYTVGGFIQGNRTQSVGGIEVLTVNKAGLFQLETALSQSIGLPLASAQRLAYRSFEQADVTRVFSNWGLQLEHRASRFTQMNDHAAGSRFAYNADAYMTFRFRARHSVTIGGYKDWAHRGFEDSNGSYANLTSNLSPEVQATVDLSATDDPMVRHERRALVGLRWRENLRPVTSGISHDSRDSGTRGEAVYNGQKARVDMSVADNRTTAGANASITSLMPRAQLGYNFSAYESKVATINRVTRSTSLVQVGTALAFADGTFALSRPVADSFAIVGNHGEKWQNGTRFDSNDNGFANEVNAWGPAVVPDLNSYRRRQIDIDTSPLETGLGLKQTEFRLRPSYRSGYHLGLAVNSIVIARLRLLLPDGTAAALESGEVRFVSAESLATTPQSQPVGPIAADSLEVQEFFSNRDGQVEVAGLNPGTYEIIFYSNRFVPIRIEIPPKTTGIFELGTIDLKKVEGP